jgi:hypothetical protein
VILHRKNIVPDDTCEVCSNGPETTTPHLATFGLLPASTSTPPPTAPDCISFLDLPRRPRRPSPHLWPCVAGISRNIGTSMCFGMSPPRSLLAATFRACLADVRLWVYCLATPSKRVLGVPLSPACNSPCPFCFRFFFQLLDTKSCCVLPNAQLFSQLL